MKLCQQPNDNILDFLAYLDENHIETWIRHVIVEGITLNDEYLDRLGYFIGQFHCIKALDCLPYHGMGEVKYEKLGIDYPLKGMKNLPQEKAIHAREVILAAMKRRRNDEA